MINVGTCKCSPRRQWTSWKDCGLQIRKSQAQSWRHTLRCTYSLPLSYSSFCPPSFLPPVPRLKIISNISFLFLLPPDHRSKQPEFFGRVDGAGRLIMLPRWPHVTTSYCYSWYPISIFYTLRPSPSPLPSPPFHLPPSISPSLTSPSLPLL